MKINMKNKYEYLVTLYLKAWNVVHYTFIFNALIMSCNAPYNALYYLMNIFNHSYNTVTMILIYVLCIMH